ncbi:MAG: hypothetical protein AAFO29_06805, partial [Actinomycetota bacterium]
RRRGVGGTGAGDRINGLTLMIILALESGLTAAWFGLVVAVVLGGVGTLAVVGVGMLAFPALRKVDRFEDVRPASLSDSS